MNTMGTITAKAAAEKARVEPIIAEERRIFDAEWEIFEAKRALAIRKARAMGYDVKDDRPRKVFELDDSYPVVRTEWVRSCVAEPFTIKGAVTGQKYKFKPSRRSCLIDKDDLAGALATGLVYRTIGGITGNPCIHGSSCSCRQCYGMGCCSR